MDCCIHKTNFLKRCKEVEEQMQKDFEAYGAGFKDYSMMISYFHKTALNHDSVMKKINAWRVENNLKPL